MDQPSFESDNVAERRKETSACKPIPVTTSRRVRYISQSRLNLGKKERKLKRTERRVFFWGGRHEQRPTLSEWAEVPGGEAPILVSRGSV